jgi:uncharacterized membrane protein
MSRSVLPGDLGRLDRIDLLRAAAMLWMTVYHFCFDLNHFGFIEQNFYRDPFWTWQRTAIVSLFLFTAGLSQAVALHQDSLEPLLAALGADPGCCAAGDRGLHADVSPQLHLFRRTCMALP